MMRYLVTFVKFQLKYLVILLAVFVVPVGILLHNEKYVLPNIQYIALILLFISQYILYKENSFVKSIEKEVKQTLNKELKRVPSNQEIISRCKLIVQFRGISIAIAAISIIALMIFRQKF